MINGTTSAQIIASGATAFLAQLSPVIFLIGGLLFCYVFIFLFVDLFKGDKKE